MAFYGAVAFAVLQAVDLLVPVLGLSDSVTRGVALLLLLGAPVAMFLEWVFEFTPGGLRRTTEPTPGELSAILKAPASKRWPSVRIRINPMRSVLSGVTRQA